MVEINWKKLVLAAIAFLIVAQVVYTVGAMGTMDYYTNPEYFGLWSKVMMPAEGPPPLSFHMYSMAVGFVSALIFGYAYEIAKPVIPGTGKRKGINYGIFLFFLATIPGALSMLLIFNVPIGLWAAWAITDLLIYLIGGIIFWKLLGE